MQATEFNVEIGDGHKYAIRIDESGKVIGTACEGRWTMCNVPTGSAWLDAKLQDAADKLSQHFQS